MLQYYNNSNLTEIEEETTKQKHKPKPNNYQKCENKMHSNQTNSEHNGE